MEKAIERAMSRYADDRFARPPERLRSGANGPEGVNPAVWDIRPPRSSEETDIRRMSKKDILSHALSILKDERAEASSDAGQRGHDTEQPFTPSLDQDDWIRVMRRDASFHDVERDRSLMSRGRENDFDRRERDNMALVQDDIYRALVKGDLDRERERIRMAYFERDALLLGGRRERDSEAYVQGVDLGRGRERMGHAHGEDLDRERGVMDRFGGDFIRGKGRGVMALVEEDYRRGGLEVNNFVGERRRTGVDPVEGGDFGRRRDQVLERERMWNTPNRKRDLRESLRELRESFREPPVFDMPPSPEVAISALPPFSAAPPFPAPPPFSAVPLLPTPAPPPFSAMPPFPGGPFPIMNPQGMERNLEPPAKQMRRDGFHANRGFPAGRGFSSGRGKGMNMKVKMQQPHSGPQHTHTVYFAGVNPATPSGVIRQFFSSFGPYVKVFMKYEEGRFLGFGNVVYPNATIVESLFNSGPHLLEGKQIFLLQKIPPNELAHVSQEKRTVYVGGLKKLTTSKKVRDYFKRFGSVEQAFVKPVKKGLQKSYTYGLVVFTEPHMIYNVFTTAPHTIDGKQVLVNIKTAEAMPAEQLSKAKGKTLKGKAKGKNLKGTEKGKNLKGTAKGNSLKGTAKGKSLKGTAKGSNQQKKKQPKLDGGK